LQNFLFIKFKINGDRVGSITELKCNHGSSTRALNRKYCSPRDMLISGRRYSGRRRRNRWHQRLVCLSVSHELIWPFSSLSHALCFFFIGPKEIFSQGTTRTFPGHFLT